jgi:hypothetical protein
MSEDEGVRDRIRRKVLFHKRCKIRLPAHVRRYLALKTNSREIGQ